MYLTRLNEKQKVVFLELAYQIVSADGNYSDAEKQMMTAYYREMELSSETEVKEKKLEEIIAELNKAFGIVEKKIVVFEAVGLAMIDGNCASSEKDILNRVQSAIGIPTEYYSQCESLIKDYIELQNKINMAILQ